MAHQGEGAKTSSGLTAADYLRSGGREAMEVELVVRGAIAGGAVMKLTVWPNTSVGEIKRKIFELVSVPTHVQRLSCPVADDPTDADTVCILGYPEEMQMKRLAFDPSATARVYPLAEAGDQEGLERCLRAPANPDWTDKEDGETPLHVAARNGHAAAVNALCLACGDMDAPMEGGVSPLHLAAKGGHIDVIKSLVFEHSAHKDRRAQDGATPLHWAAHAGQWAAVDLLCNAKCSLTLATAEGLLPLHMAAHDGHSDIVQRLLDARSSFNLENAEGKTPLYFAAEAGCLEAVNFLCEFGADTSKAIRKSGWAPLHAASVYCFPDIVRRLCEHQANAGQQTVAKESPLHLGVAAGDLDVARTLLEFRADVNKVMIGGSTPFHIAVQTKKKDMVDLLIDNFAQVLLPKEDGSSALFLAAEDGSVELAEMIVKACGDPDLAGQYFRTPLILSTEHGHVGMVRFLCSVRANPDKPMDEGVTPLFTAAELGHAEILQILCDSGATRDLRLPKDQRSALHIACQQGHKEATRVLCMPPDEDSPGADLNAIMRLGWSPLHIAAQQGHEDVTSVLSSFGAKLDVLSDDMAGEGWPPLLMAAQEGHEAVCQVLRQRGADIKGPLEIARRTGDQELVNFVEKLC